MPDDRTNNSQLDLNLRRRATDYLDAKQKEARAIAENPGALRSLLDAGRDWLRRFADKLNPNTKSGLTTIYRMIAASVSGREEYWLDVAENVASILTFLKSRSVLAKFSLADDFAQNAATFHRHQFVQYAKFFRDAFDAQTEIADAAPPALPDVRATDR